MFEIAGISILPTIGFSSTFDWSVELILSFDLSTESLLDFSVGFSTYLVMENLNISLNLLLKLFLASEVKSTALSLDSEV